MNTDKGILEKIKVLAFDLDDTLAESKAPISADMSSMLSALLPYFYICIISGGAFKQMQTQVIEYLPPTNFDRLIFFPENGNFMYTWSAVDGTFQAKYKELLSDAQRNAVFSAFKLAEEKFPELIGSQVMSQIYGERIEDRGGQITFSALGQEAPVAVKKAWDPDRSKRKEIKEFLDKTLPPELEARIGGATSLDVTHKGKDKGYAVNKLLKASQFGLADFTLDQILFFGDSLDEGGNDYPVKAVGVQTVAVSGPGDTLSHLRDIAGAIIEAYGEKARS